MRVQILSGIYAVCGLLLLPSYSKAQETPTPCIETPDTTCASTNPQDGLVPYKRPERIFSLDLLESKINEYLDSLQVVGGLAAGAFDTTELTDLMPGVNAYIGASLSRKVNFMIELSAIGPLYVPTCGAPGCRPEAYWEAFSEAYASVQYFVLPKLWLKAGAGRFKLHALYKNGNRGLEYQGPVVSTTEGMTLFPAKGVELQLRQDFFFGGFSFARPEVFLFSALVGVSFPQKHLR